MLYIFHSQPKPVKESNYIIRYRRLPQTRRYCIWSASYINIRKDFCLTERIYLMGDVPYDIKKKCWFASGLEGWARRVRMKTINMYGGVSLRNYDK